MKGTLTAQQLSVMDDMPLLGQRVDEATLPTPTTAVIYVEGADGSLHPAIWLKCGGKPSDLLAWFSVSKRKLGELGGKPAQLTLISRALLSLQKYASDRWGMIHAEDAVMPWSTLVQLRADEPRLRYAIRWTHTYDGAENYIRTGLTLEVLG